MFRAIFWDVWWMIFEDLKAVLTVRVILWAMFWSIFCAIHIMEGFVDYF